MLLQQAWRRASGSIIESGSSGSVIGDASSALSAGPGPLSRQAAAAATGASLLPSPQQHSLSGRRGMFAVIEVRNNNVDAAYGRLSRQCQEQGLQRDLGKRAHFVPKHERKFEKARASFNKRVGSQIRDRIKWVVKRRHV